MTPCICSNKAECPSHRHAAEMGIYIATIAGNKELPTDVRAQAVDILRVISSDEAEARKARVIAAAQRFAARRS